MELAPRYCRTCGSRILVKHICNSCNNNPLKGDNYCYDCGALTPNAESCLNCGAKYTQSFSLKPIIYGAILVVAISIAAYLFFDFGSGNTQQIFQQKNTIQVSYPTPLEEEIPAQKPVINNPVVDTAKVVVSQKIDTPIHISNPIKKDSVAVKKKQPLIRLVQKKL